MNLNQVNVSVSDVARSIAFYQKLGLQLVVASLPEHARFSCPDGQGTFSLSLVEAQTLVYFECADPDQRVADLQTQGVQFSMLPTDQPWLWREAYLDDPDGNPLCLFFAGVNRLNPPWRLV
jgi:catechol 2,3-dioxygenase-like lactoylglutathione lyase family enzyme